ncbi:MAG: ABC transporter ATP-binding protein [Epsilonproteobacteria bacterium]|nr:ABC transporter ATP-binding protein [Campylobacterota bacterium]
MAKIIFKNLAHSYLPNPKVNKDYALQKINLELEDGAAYALLGPSGCGKTTLLNIISGLLIASEGKIYFDDKDVTFSDTVDRNIAQVFQFPVVYDTMSVRKNLAFPLRNRGENPKYIKKRVEAIAKSIGMEDILDKKASGLSADAKQKISLGRGMVREDVNAILLDEPLTVIDPHVKWKLRTQLKALHEEFSHTMIFVTHDQTEALTFADKVVVMNDGVVVQVGSPQELFEKPAHTFVGFFIGSPGMNIFRVDVTHDIVSIGDVKLKLKSSYKNLNGKIELGIRPEYIKLSKDSGDIELEITRIEDIGYHKIVRAKHQGMNINIIVPEDIKITQDFKYASFDTNHLFIYQDGWLVEPTGGKS